MHLVLGGQQRPLQQVPTKPQVVWPHGAPTSQLPFRQTPGEVQQTLPHKGVAQQIWSPFGAVRQWPGGQQVGLVLGPP
jgi:hypothetical protein